MLNTIVLAAGGAHEPNGALFSSDVNEIIWGTVAFLIVLALLIWKGLPAAKGMAQARRDRLVGELDAAAAEREAAETALGELQQRIANADEECARIRSEADGTAAELKAQLIAKADADAAETRQRALADAASASAQVSQGLEEELGRLAVGAAEAVVRDTLDADTHAALVDSYITRVGSGS